MHLDQLLESLLKELKELSSSGSIVGKPLALGQTHLVPLSRITVGFGAGAAVRQKQDGGGQSGSGRGELQGEGAGGAISVEPRAFVVVGPDGRPAMLTPRKGGLAVLSRGLAVHDEEAPPEELPAAPGPGQPGAGGAGSGTGSNG